MAWRRQGKGAINTSPSPQPQHHGPSLNTAHCSFPHLLSSSTASPLPATLFPNPEPREIRRTERELSSDCRIVHNLFLKMNQNCK